MYIINIPGKILIIIIYELNAEFLYIIFLWLGGEIGKHVGLKHQCFGLQIRVLFQLLKFNLFVFKLNQYQIKLIFNLVLLVDK